MANTELLEKLATAYGFGLTYRGMNNEIVSSPHSSMVKLLRALDVPLSDDPADEELHEALGAWRVHWDTRPLPPVVIAREGEETHFNVHVPEGAPADVWITLEDGSTSEVYQDENWAAPTFHDGVNWGEATFHTRGDVPMGWHTIHLSSKSDEREIEETCTLVVTPRVLTTNLELLKDPVWGVMAQLYSVRSENSWGIGDFHDLAELAEVVAAQGADYLLINPVHAAEPFPPVEDSPYLPTSRRFVNPIYIAAEDVPEFAQLDEETREEIAELSAELRAMNRSPEFIDRDTIFDTKLAILNEMFYIFEESDQSAFDEYVENQGEGLVNFARWCAYTELTREDERRHAVIITEEYDDLAQFYMWLQFLADTQLAQAQRRAKDAGMRIGIMTDLAVGVHPGGADANTLADVLVQDASVGAPPDGYSQQGQDWSQPPWHPFKLAEAGYKPWRDLLRTVLKNSGGIRVDHILGLFRLFWIPRMESPLDGVYMNYDHEAMLGILALEAERAGAVVVGEDLGTFEPWVQDVLRDRGVLGTSVIWFEHSPAGDRPMNPEEYRNLSMSSVGTHDLPPTAGYLKGAHNELRDALGIVEDSFEELDAKDVAWQGHVLANARDHGAFAGTPLADYDFDNLGRDERGDTEELVLGLTRFIAGTGSALTCTNLVDMVGDVRIQNQPGTNAEQYKNWCVPLSNSDGEPVLIEDLTSIDLFARVAEASARR
ncbi:4-alpha-glucanotransferase [Corynebacterium sp. CCUG 70398]|uniref:4-alpha-glucanotransferase n=1 Tax=Corynebacterium sp. CCUG 70398 TaxID=2823891 RepID=UPI0021089D56|nr:4-alpha-glucanotransferase [Corynebacterium sp. CCUG 70398]